MALELADLPVITALRRQFPGGGRLAILGDCQFHFDRRALHGETDVALRVTAHDGTQDDPHGDAPVSAAEFGRALGFTDVATFDIAGSPTFRVDLQQPIAAEFHARYDWVIDAGTLFWCFDPAAVWRNVLAMLADDGCVMHVAALTGYFGRGYYALQPRLFRDFYLRNGFDVVTLGTRTRPGRVSRVRRLAGRLFQANTETPSWRLMAADAAFLRRASRWSLEFADTLALNEHGTAIEPEMVPNNSVVMCFVHRRERVPFAPADALIP